MHHPASGKALGLSIASFFFAPLWVYSLALALSARSQGARNTEIQVAYVLSILSACFWVLTLLLLFTGKIKLF